MEDSCCVSDGGRDVSDGNIEFPHLTASRILLASSIIEGNLSILEFRDSNLVCGDSLIVSDIRSLILSLLSENGDIDVSYGDIEGRESAL